MVTEQKPETRTASLRSIRKRPEKDQSRAKDILTPCWQYGPQIYDCTADKEPKWSWARYRKRTALVTPAEERNIGADRQRHNEMLPISSCKLKVYHEIGPNLYSYDVFLKLRKVTVFFHWNAMVTQRYRSEIKSLRASLKIFTMSFLYAR